MIMAKTQWPIDGTFGKTYKVTSAYGWRKDPLGRADKKHHNGVDLWGAAETIYIEAFADGTVLHAGPSLRKKADGSVGGFGYYVVLLHKIDGKFYTSAYAHMKQGSIKVKKGQKVTAGAVLGVMGTTGDSTGKHLHWEIWIGKTHGWSDNGKGFLDPIEFCKAMILKERALAAGKEATAPDAPVAKAPVHEAPKKAPVAPKAAAPVVAAAPVAKKAPVAKAAPAKSVYKEPFAPKLRNDEFGNLAPYRNGRPHRGQDWSPAELAPIPSICDGKVHNVFWTDVLGWVIEVWEPIEKVFIQYAHVAPKTATVKKGDLIKLGQVIGKVGGGRKTPSGSASTGAHLHMQISKKPNGHLAAYSALIDPLKHILAHSKK
jgi:murein DD-endopeptidase MepM/ murein hydrolase activator NlpD